MLRVLVLVLLLANAGLFFWLRADPHALQADREPQRLAHQVAPDAIEVLPDLPASGAPGAAGEASGAASAAQPTSAASSPASAAVAAASGASTVAVAVRGSGPAELARAREADLQCSESTALDDTQANALRLALTKAGVPAAALGERRQSQGGTWAVYMGRFPDGQAWQNKADELKRMNLSFERVYAPPALAPGLSLGRYPSAGEAQKRLDELGRHGVHTARVVALAPPTVLHFLQVRAADPAWHHAAGAQRFNSCPAAAPSQL